MKTTASAPVEEKKAAEVQKSMEKLDISASASTLDQEEVPQMDLDEILATVAEYRQEQH